MTRLPSLGPRGEGWLALQLVAIVAVVYAASVDPWRIELPSGIGSMLAVVGTALSVLGVTIVVIAASELGRRHSFSTLPMPAADGVLVETGLYARVRHPVYSGIVLAELGWAVASASPLALGALVVLVVVLNLKAAREEIWLAKRYPGYAAYRARTRRLIPGLL